MEERAASPCLINAADGRTLTYAEVHEQASRLAGALLEGGFSPGDRVVVSVPNSVELALLYLAALYAGVTVIPLGPGFGIRELRSILTRTRSSRMLHSAGTASRLVELAAECGLETIPLSTCRPSEPANPFAHWRPDDLVAIHFTSGTTGPPRGIGHRLGDFLANSRRMAGAIGAGPDLRFHAMLPMTYLGGYYNLLLLPLAIGASVVVDRPFDGEMALDYWSAPIRHDVSALWLVPSIMAMLLKVDRAPYGRQFCRERVRVAAVGMGPLSAELREEFDQAYGTSVLENYGLAETLLAASATREHPPPPGACGAALEGVRLRIVGDDGHELPPGSAGAIQIASPDTMVGYLDELEGSDPGQRAGDWFDTGDLGVLDHDGQLRITGRVKELIIRGGVNVSALAIEEALSGQPGVERLAVVGVPHPMLGEDIAVVVQCEPRIALEDIEGELRALAREALDPAQRPGVYVQIDELPLTPSGKVRSQVVRGLVIDRLGLTPVRG